jgi:hypothetical protein
MEDRRKAGDTWPSSFITKWKVEMLDDVFSVQVRCGQLPLLGKRVKYFLVTHC